MKVMQFAQKDHHPWKIANGMFPKEMEFVFFKTGSSSGAP